SGTMWWLSCVLDVRCKKMLAVALLAGAGTACHGGAITSLEGASCAAKEYRSFDGTCNNALNPTWGSAGSQLLRLGAASYEGEISQPRSIGAFGALPSTRDVSNAVVDQSRSIPNSKGFSAMLMQWGQFLDHDIDLTRAGNTESLPIAVPTDDLVFNSIYPNGQMPFSRSVYDAATATDASNPRQQINAVTAFIDASQIYGSSKVEGDSLRDFSGGKLKMTGDMLHMEDGVFVSGDERAREQIGLTSMHTLFNREHNRLAGKLEAEYRLLPDVDGITPADSAYERRLDEKVYQEARKITGAMMQAITYNEFLPALLGEGALHPYTKYQSDLNPGINNEFSTAAYRFGHSTLAPSLLRLGADREAIDAGPLALRDGFFTPETLLTAANGGVEAILLGLASQRGQEIDPFLVDDVRNFLFGPVGFDLAALNMQRGRDHGLPSYNEMRTELGMTAFSGWNDMNVDAILMDGMKELLMSVYEDINDIDLWVGGLAEKHAKGGMLGELFSWIVSDQFTRLRDGDRFWYQNNMFEDVWVDLIERSTLSAIIMRNTGITDLRTNVFFVPEPGVLLLLSMGIAGLLASRPA
ncbi:MAG: peroxidase family protein, partial [Sedimenticolaceae bacterium]